jgi:hypothetical protein
VTRREARAWRVIAVAFGLHYLVAGAWYLWAPATVAEVWMGVFALVSGVGIPKLVFYLVRRELARAERTANYLRRKVREGRL